ncbi:hypothetical protein Aph01nite_34570 [Acrocarpospora phusangensis]|uniref:Uncharacterized protein n=1 Tax=Acrocarpospora phusangensis TaxID=1070424 RepID=A0A919QA43_9ACTN|nr:hypothetical protein [Acrocarpospora phusangensis]GIH25147.1 hypothetical protein Aph01nite_34570 [Acrocarpospora phusangensis]
MEQDKPATILARHAAQRRWDDLTPEQRTEATAAACARNPSSLSYWALKVDPDGVLDEDERDRQAREKRRTYCREMALAREARRREQKGAGDAAA